MKEIPLSQEKIAIVDVEDYEVVSQYHWYTRKTSHNFYAVTHIYQDGKRTTLAMHQLIMLSYFGQQVDHINGNGLDNRKKNLRVVTHQQNNFNRKYTFGTSKYKGVSWNKRDNCWQATIKFNNKAKMLGYFKEEVEAAKSYNSAAKKYFGEFAALNEVEIK